MRGSVPVAVALLLRSPSSRGEAYHDGMRIFLAGASGVIGQRLIPRLVHAGHIVGGLTRSPSKTELLSHLGAEPILCDVFDRGALIQAVHDFKPDVVLNELTDLPDDAAQISELADLNARMRTEGTRNLIEAARRSDARPITSRIWCSARRVKRPRRLADRSPSQRLSSAASAWKT